MDDGLLNDLMGGSDFMSDSEKEYLAPYEPAVTYNEYTTTTDEIPF